tara:strand:+ start:144 stop:437 length:294 start_codon:yes stop_codon:yes gene_type:complete
MLFVIKKNKPQNVKQLNIKDPIEPEIVLLGLILVILGPLNVLPIINPPISEDIQVIKSENKIALNGVFSERIKNSVKKINKIVIKSKLQNNLDKYLL